MAITETISTMFCGFKLTAGHRFCVSTSTESRHGQEQKHRREPARSGYSIYFSGPRHVARRSLPSSLSGAPAPPPVCVETIGALERLLDGARRGHFVGIAYAVTTTKRDYQVDVIGDFRSDLAYALGAVAVLDDELRELVREGAGSAWR